MTVCLTVCGANCQDYSCSMNICHYIGKTIYPTSMCIMISAGCKDYSPDIDEVETHSGKMPYGGGKR